MTLDTASPWLRIRLTEEQVLANVEAEIQRTCEGLWNEALRPHDAALFIDRVRPDDGGVSLYLSREMARLCRAGLQLYRSESIEAPIANDVVVLLANGDVRDLLAPSDEQAAPPKIAIGGTFVMPRHYFDVPTVASEFADLRGTLDLSIRVGPVLIVPTLYPSEATGTLHVENRITINIHSAPFQEFSAKIDELIARLSTSNEIAGEVRDKLIAELRAGMEILRAPKPDPKMIDLLLIRPLKYVGDKAAGPVIGAVALAALALLGKLSGLF